MEGKMDMKKEMLLKELMALDFTITELNLYLDTHPGDQKALSLYNSNVSKAKSLREQYEEIYGLLTARYTCSKYPWQWVSGRWPWEKSFMD